MTDQEGKVLEKKMTRRDFLKLTGMSAVGVSALSWLLPGCTSRKDEVAVFESASGVIIHEPNRCTGCLLCETSCTAVNDGKVSQHLARIKVSGNYQYGKEGPRGAWQQRAGEMGNFLLTAETCRQCERPACALACPEGAIFQETKAGAREVYPSKCVGCGTCVRACPWEIPVVDTETDVATKCVLCHGYSACVAVCPTNALHFVGWDDAVRRYREHFVTDTI